jgi:hypothetical protein
MERNNVEQTLRASVRHADAVSATPLAHLRPVCPEDAAPWSHWNECHHRAAVRSSLSLGVCLLNRLDRKEQIQVVVSEWNEAVSGVELPGLGIDGQDFDRKQAELSGQFQAAWVLTVLVCPTE